MAGLARAQEGSSGSGKIADAEKEYVEAANLDGSDPEPHRQMGALKIKLGEFGAAAKEYTRALNINPSSVPDLVSLGYCYAENDDYMQAEVRYVTALALQQLLVQNIDVTSERLDIMRSLAVLLVPRNTIQRCCQSARFDYRYAQTWRRCHPRPVHACQSQSAARFDGKERH